MRFSRHGLDQLLPEQIRLLHGPGCPVCVTSAAHMDAFIAMAEIPGVRVAIFGDLFRIDHTGQRSLSVCDPTGETEGKCFGGVARVYTKINT